MFWVGLILGGMLGGFIGMITIALMVVTKERDEENMKTYEVAENNLQKYYTRPFNDIKLEGFKTDLKIILRNDIEFYKKMYDINKSTYYYGRIEQCKFILGLVEGRKENEVR